MSQVRQDAPERPEALIEGSSKLREKIEKSGLKIQGEEEGPFGLQ